MKNEKIISKIDNLFWNNRKFRCELDIGDFLKGIDGLSIGFFESGFRNGFELNNVFFEIGKSLGFDGLIDYIENYLLSLDRKNIKKLYYDCQNHSADFDKLCDDIYNHQNDNKKKYEIEDIYFYLFGFLMPGEIKNEKLDNNSDQAKLKLLGQDFYFIILKKLQ